MNLWLILLWLPVSGPWPLPFVQSISRQAPFSPKHASIATATVSSAVRTDTTEEDLANYHLIWSPGFVKKTTTAAAGLFLIEYFNGFQFVVPTFLARAFENLVLPLFASACCVIQLAINLVAGGCAGFNTVLGPIRPYFVALLFFLTVKKPASPATVALRWMVAFLPEALDLLNHFLEKRKVPLVYDLQQWQVEIEVPTMGCVACINTIDIAVRKMSMPNGHVVEASSALKPLGMKGGTVSVVLAAESERDARELAQKLVVAVKDAGFDGGTIASIRDVIP